MGQEHSSGRDEALDYIASVSDVSRETMAGKSVRCSGPIFSDSDEMADEH